MSVLQIHTSLDPHWKSAQSLCSPAYSMGTLTYADLPKSISTLDKVQWFEFCHKSWSLCGLGPALAEKEKNIADIWLLAIYIRKVLLLIQFYLNPQTALRFTMYLDKYPIGSAGKVTEISWALMTFESVWRSAQGGTRDSLRPSTPSGAVISVGLLSEVGAHCHEKHWLLIASGPRLSGQLQWRALEHNIFIFFISSLWALLTFIC